jgi:hypothetical protein
VILQLPGFHGCDRFSCGGGDRWTIPLTLPSPGGQREERRNRQDRTRNVMRPQILPWIIALASGCRRSAGWSGPKTSICPRCRTRQSVQLTIYNSEDLTLVRETRKVSFKPGANPLEFSWANTLIDPSSVRTPLPHASRQARSPRHHLPPRQAATALLERPERAGRRGDGRDHLFHQRHKLVGRLPGGRQPRRDGDEAGRLRPGLEQLGRRVRGRPGPAGRRADQPRGEDRPVGATPDQGAARLPGEDKASGAKERKLALAIEDAGRWQERRRPTKATCGAPPPSRSSRKG